MKTLLIITPHMSTGGCPQVVVRKVEVLKDIYNVIVVEWDCVAWDYVVQRNKTIDLIGENFITLYENKEIIFDIINEKKPDYIMIEEFSETFIPEEILVRLYDENRPYKIFETTHSSHTEPSWKRYFPDKFIFVSPYSLEVFRCLNIPMDLIEYPINIRKPNKEESMKILNLDPEYKHIINIGLFTSGKNQGYAFEMARVLLKHKIKFHFIGNQAVNFKDYWETIMKHKPNNCIVWGERNDVDLFIQSCDAHLFTSKLELNPISIKESLEYEKPTMIFNLPTYMGKYNHTDNIHFLTGNIIEDCTRLLKSLKIDINEPKNNSKQQTNYEFMTQYMTSFGDTIPEFNINVEWNHIDGFYLNLLSDSDEIFDVKIYDKDDILLYEDKLSNNTYCKLFRKYYNGIKYKIFKGPFLIKEEDITFKGKKVFIAFDSSSLGDTISWVPYCEEFRKIHECEVVVSTFLNFLFIKSYPKLTFVNPGEVVDDIHAMFKIGWFYDNSLEPENPATIPLQKGITNILGLDFIEIKSKVDFIPNVRPYEEKYVTIATNSTAGCKLWNNPTGWLELISYLKSKGYRVINVSKDADDYPGAEKLINDDLQNTMNVIYYSDFFIGLSSGLSWLSWALNKQVVMISNFTLNDHEFQTNCIRITNSNSCNGCWNNPNFKFDKGDWNWCPIWKNTPRHFECHKSITSDMVINQIQHLLN
jgi:autotransporter strand-loop-strand O-heptosyltransferase